MATRLLAILSIVALIFGSMALAGTVKEDVVGPYVEVVSPSGVGSGCVIQVKGEILILTADHVVAPESNMARAQEFGSPEIRVKLRRKVGSRVEEREGRVVYWSPHDTGHDLALIKPDDCKGLSPAQLLKDPEPEVGEDVWYVGTRLGVHGSVERSVLSKDDYTHERDSETYYVLNGNGTYGNSGGPVFVKRGSTHYLIGVVVQLREVEPRTPILAVRLDTVRKFLTSWVESRK